MRKIKLSKLTETQLFLFKDAVENIYKSLPTTTYNEKTILFCVVFLYKRLSGKVVFIQPTGNKLNIPLHEASAFVCGIQSCGLKTSRPEIAAMINEIIFEIDGQLV